MTVSYSCRHCLLSINHLFAHTQYLLGVCSGWLMGPCVLASAAEPSGRHRLSIRVMEIETRMINVHSMTLSTVTSWRSRTRVNVMSMSWRSWPAFLILYQMDDASLVDASSSSPSSSTTPEHASPTSSRYVNGQQYSISAKARRH